MKKIKITFIEFLAIIFITFIILAITVPQILEVIKWAKKEMTK